MTPDLDRFEAWLKERHFSEVTIRTTLRDVRRLLKTDEPVTGSAKSSMLRYAWFIEPADLETANRLRARTKSIREPGGHAGKRRRKRPAVAHPDADWARLVEALAQDETIEGRVLAVIAATGLRIGDVLRLSTRALNEGLESGVITVVQKGAVEKLQPVSGAGGAWEALAEAMPRGARNVAGGICPDNDSPVAGDCAQKAVARHLKWLGQELGLEGRMHLHRMRRTLIVQALRVTRDIHAVQEFAGHRKLATTSLYVDEPMPERTAELQKQIRERFTKR